VAAICDDAADHAEAAAPIDLLAVGEQGGSRFTVWRLRTDSSIEAEEKGIVGKHREATPAGARVVEIFGVIARGFG